MKIGSWQVYFHYLRECIIDRLALIRAIFTGREPAQAIHQGKQVTGVQDYDAWYYNQPRARAYMNHPRRAINLVDMIARFAPSNVFEFGSGLGHIVQEARRRGIQIVGTETSDYAVRHSLCPKAIIRIGEIPQNSLPFPDEAFDLVFSTEVMEHVSEINTMPVLRELHRICSRYALFTINTSDMTEPGHINMHPRGWWLKAFHDVGFAHNNSLWKEMERIKYLDWEIFALEKSTSPAAPVQARFPG